MRTLLPISIFAVVVLGAACDSDPKTTVDAPTVQQDAPPMPDAPPDAPPIKRDGFIVLSEQIEMGTLQSDVDAVFAANAPFGPQIGMDGACTAHDTPPDEGYSAGTITIAGTTAPITLTPEGAAPMVRYVESVPSPDNLFAPGAVITIQATGGDVPAFNTTITAPTVFAGYTPPATIPRGMGRTFTWTAGSGPNVWLILVGITQVSLRIVLCKVPDTGSYALTPSNVALMPAASTTMDTAFMLVGRAVTAEVTAGTGTVNILAIDSVASEVTFTP